MSEKHDAMWGREAGEYIAQQQAEITRLRRDLEIWRRNGGDILLKIEIDRLQALKTPASRQLLNITKAALDNADQRLDATESECAKLRAALDPFARYADPTGKTPSDFVITKGSNLARKQLIMGDCYDACKALADKEK